MDAYSTSFMTQWWMMEEEDDDILFMFDDDEAEIATYIHLVESERQMEANKRKLEAAAKSAKKRKAPVKRDPATDPPSRSGRLARIPENEKPVYREVNLKSASVQVSESNARVPREPLRWSGRLANLPEKPMYREDSYEESSYQDLEEETEGEMSYQDSNEERSYQDSNEERSYQDSDKRSDG